MKKTFKKFFIPHSGNNYHPHILHTKRALLYAMALIGFKAIVFGFVLLLPSAVFVLPDILTEQQNKIVALTNELRAQKGLSKLVLVNKLNNSSDYKAVDMATKSYFSHTSPEGHKLAYFLNKAGYDYNTAGENLALGFSSGEEVVNAWIKSPTHYANLIDKDFKEIGVSLENGMYEGQPTVYVAEHFGTPVKEDVALPAESSPVFETVSTPGLEENNMATVEENKKVAGVEISKKLALSTLVDESEKTATVVPPPISIKTIYNQEDSKVFWEEKNNATTFTVEANISGPVASAVVNINGYTIALKNADSNSYFGSLTVQEPSDSIFKIIISPTITIVDRDGKVIKDGINWDRVKIVSPTPIQKYMYAREWMSGMFPIFSISKNIYLGFLIFFSIVLAINILVEIRKQHHHIILQTLILIGLIACLFII